MHFLTNKTRRILLVLFALSAAVAGCDSLLDVNQPTRIPEDALDKPGLAGVMVASAIADFDCAYAGFVLASGAITDELISSNSAGGVESLDRRLLLPTGDWTTNDCVQIEITAVASPGVYTPLAVARFAADDAIRRLTGYTQQQVGARDSLLAVANAYAGFAYTLFGEVFCEMRFDGGPVLPPDSALIRAEGRFTDALTLATKLGNSGNDIRYLASAGRARVRLDLRQNAEAAADAKVIPKGFAKNAQYSAVNQRRENYVYLSNRFQRAVSVDARYRSLTVGGVADPRVKVVDSGRRGADNLTQAWYQTKYTSASSPIQLAGWNEAQLIIAEAEGGQSAVDRINALRAAAQLPQFSSADPIAIAAQVREERRRELFMDGHRWGDMLRWKIPFDSGFTERGKPYGDWTCAPLPAIEN